MNLEKQTDLKVPPTKTKLSPTIKLNNKRDTTNTYSDTEHLTTDGRILKWLLEKQDGLTQNRD
jgi:hypothetical protein